MTDTASRIFFRVDTVVPGAVAIFGGVCVCTAPKED